MLFKFKNHARFRNREPIFNWRFVVWLFLLAMIVCGFIWGGITLKSPDNFPIEKIKIVAPYQHVEPKVLQEVISAFAMRGFFNLDVVSLKQRLLMIPWVYAVEIKREWPDTIMIIVWEQNAVAEWNREALLNQDGKIFRPEHKTFPNKLPQLFGEDVNAFQVWRNYQNMQLSLSSLHFNISQLSLDAQGFWHITLGTGEELFIGYASPLSRLQDFIAAYPKIIASHPDPNWVRVDLRYEDGVAIKWKN